MYKRGTRPKPSKKRTQNKRKIKAGKTATTN